MLTPIRFRQGGFTLIEAMIAIALLALLLALGAPSLQNWLKNARIRTTAEEALAGVQLARSEAVRSNCIASFALTDGGGWEVERGTNCPGGSGVQSRSEIAAVGEVVVTPTPDAATTVSFGGTGFRVANEDRSPTLTSFVVDLPSSVLDASETRELQIEIERNGQIRMCDPNASDERACD